MSTSSILLSSTWDPQYGWFRPLHGRPVSPRAKVALRLMWRLGKRYPPDPSIKCGNGKPDIKWLQMEVVLGNASINRGCPIATFDYQGVGVMMCSAMTSRTKSTAVEFSDQSSLLVACITRISVSGFQDVSRKEHWNNAKTISSWRILKGSNLWPWFPWFRIYGCDRAETLCIDIQRLYCSWCTKNRVKDSRYKWTVANIIQYPSPLSSPSIEDIIGTHVVVPTEAPRQKPHLLAWPEGCETAMGHGWILFRNCMSYFSIHI